MNIEVEEFLEHYGKRGMRWGQRKARTPEEKRSRNKKIAVGVGVLAGVAVAALILRNKGHLKLGSAKQTKVGQQAASKVMNNVGKTKMSDPGFVARKMAQRDLAARQTKLLKEINLDLTKNYNKNNIPFPKRDPLLDTGYWEKLAKS